MSRNCSSSYPCPENQECIITEAGYGFCICPKGFTLDSATGQCRDIDECHEMNDFDLCGFYSECINTPGSYQCICAPGYTGNARTGCNRVCEWYTSSLLTFFSFTLFPFYLKSLFWIYYSVFLLTLQYNYYWSNIITSNIILLLKL